MNLKKYLERNKINVKQFNGLKTIFISRIMLSY